MLRLEIEMTDDTREFVEMIAARRGISESDVVRAAVEAYRLLEVVVGIDRAMVVGGGDGKCSPAPPPQLEGSSGNGCSPKGSPAAPVPAVLPEYLRRGREAAKRVAPNLGASSQSRQSKPGFAALLESAEKKIKRAKRLLES